MALPSFNNSTVVTTAYMNNLPNALPRTVLLAASSRDTVAATNSSSFVELARVKMRPVMGDFVHLSFEHKALGSGGPIISTRTVLEWAGQSLGPVDTDTSSTTFVTVSRSISMGNVDGNDLTAFDVDLVVYGRTKSGTTPSMEMRSLHVHSSEKSTAADSML